MRIGPLRKVVEIKRQATGLYDRDSVVLSCGHRTSSNGTNARCMECALIDKVWRTHNLSRIRLRLCELDGIIGHLPDYHSAEGHICKYCMERNSLRRILEGKNDQHEGLRFAGR